MYSLTETEFKTKAEPILRRIFDKNDPFDPQPFTPNIPEKKILVGFQYIVEPPLLQALVTAASKLGDTGCYFSSLWWASPDVLYNWYIPFSEIYTYSDENSPISDVILSEQVIYSPQAQWGIMTTHTRHALLGSTKEFMAELEKLIPDINEQGYKFLDEWRYYKSLKQGASTDWIPGLLEQIYGKEMAQKLLREYDLP
jgi:hypothetical protein